MPSKSGNRLIAAGVIGGGIAAICCFTPALVLLLSALGLAALTGYLDYVLLPAILICCGITAYGCWVRSRRAKRDNKTGS